MTVLLYDHNVGSKLDDIFFFKMNESFPKPLQRLMVNDFKAGKE